jgi:N6-adenosine-specific RNA methylase IME4
VPVDVLYLDPPWKFANRRLVRKDGGKARFGIGASGRYNTMATEQLMDLPVAEVMADPSVCFCWGSNAMAQDVLDCIDAWGFRVSTVAFTWIKLNSGRASWALDRLSNAMFRQGNLEAFLDWLAFFGIGHWTASNSELCWLGLRGSPALERVTKDVSSVIFAPVGRHSAKPPEAARRIVRLFGTDRRYLELFARIESPGSGMPGWTATGYDYDGLDVHDALCGLAGERMYSYAEIERLGYGTEQRDGEPAAPVGLLC